MFDNRQTSDKPLAIERTALLAPLVQVRLLPRVLQERPLLPRRQVDQEPHLCLAGLALREARPIPVAKFQQHEHIVFTGGNAS